MVHVNARSAKHNGLEEQLLTIWMSYMNFGHSHRSINDRGFRMDDPIDDRIDTGIPLESLRLSYSW